jgi:hypothetical protein
MNNYHQLKKTATRKNINKYIPFLITFLFIQNLFAQPPTIGSFTPTSGTIGTSVTIVRTNFSTTPANDIVYFGAVRATVSAATHTSLTVTVPAGATYQPITVTRNNLTAYSCNHSLLHLQEAAPLQQIPLQ